MRILFDNGTPRGLARYLLNHTVDEARLHGWEELENGSLIAAVEKAGFDLMLTTDKNIRYQQNLQGRTIALIVLENSQWPMVKLVAEQIVLAVDDAQSGSYKEVKVPFKSPENPPE
jgi:hypothetical protein